MEVGISGVVCQGEIMQILETGNLDLKTGEDIIDLLKELSSERGVTVISATHDYKMLNVSDQVIWIRDGKVEKIQERSELEIRTGGLE